MKKGRLNYGPMAYQTLIIADVSSMEAATAKAVYQFAKKGGKLVFVGQEPFRSSTLSDPDQDEIVKEFMQKLQAYQQHIIWMDAPAKGTNLIDWMKSVYSQLEWDPALAIDSPDRSLYQIHHQTGDTELFFITNTNRKRKIQTDVGFDLSGKRVWKWNALSGEREPVSTHTNGLHVDLDPLESMLIVIEPGRHAERTTYAVKHELDVKVTPIQGTWTALFEPVSGEPFSKTFSELPDFKNTDDPLLQNFAGKVIYSNSFNATESRFRVLDLGNANDGVTSVELNGMSLGTSWYGPPRFELDGQMRLGPNTIKIEYTSLLWNYCASLDQIETSRWIRDRDPIPNGLVGPVLLR